MEEAHTAGRHKVSVDGRKRGVITGISEVEAFDTELVMLATEQGRLAIKGSELRVIRLDPDKGEIEFSGRIDSMTYSEIRTAGKTAGGIIKRLFK